MLSNIKKEILRFDRPVPRYTSYPTAPHFQSGPADFIYTEWLRNLPEKTRLSLYVHIPFCPKLCWFCGCHTKITKRYSPVGDYLNLLMREIEMTAALRHTGQKIAHIHFGGGSPTMLKPMDFILLMKTIRSVYELEENCEIAIEIDPRQMSEAKVAAYASAGVTRASLGIQDFNTQVLESVNRAQPFYASYETIRLLRGYGIDKINLDLMYGLPHQSPETIRETIEKALFLDPDRIALFGYAHVPWMKKHMRLMPENALPAAEARLDLFEAASATLNEAGYIHIGIDHFTKPSDALARAQQQGKLHRNFQGYTDDPSDAVLGFGASAISRLPGGFIQNSPQMPSYSESILNNALPAARFFALSHEDRLREEIIQSLMCGLRADTAQICNQHGYDENFFSREIEMLHPLREAGLIEIGSNSYIKILVPQAARLASAAFDAYLGPPATSRHVTCT